MPVHRDHSAIVPAMTMLHGAILIGPLIDMKAVEKVEAHCRDGSMEARMLIGYQTVIAAPIVFRDGRLRFLSYEKGARAANLATAAAPQSEIGSLGRPNPLLRRPRGTPC
jgi:hypothetical protein